MARLARSTRASNEALLGAACTLLHASSSTLFNSARVFAIERRVGDPQERFHEADVTFESDCQIVHLTVTVTRSLFSFV
jgi:hypothetical protein